MIGLILIWCRHQESNSGPSDYKSAALPTELYRQRSAYYAEDYFIWQYNLGSFSAKSTYFFVFYLDFFQTAC